MAIRMKRAPLKRKLVLLAVDTQDVDPVGDESIWHNDQVSIRLKRNTCMKGLCSCIFMPVLKEKSTYQRKFKIITAGRNNFYKYMNYQSGMVLLLPCLEGYGKGFPDTTKDHECIVARVNSKIAHHKGKFTVHWHFCGM